MKAAGYRVQGRVQGVGFRWWTRAQATRLGLGGTVRNLEDGSVEVQLHGPAEVVDEMVRLLQQGPPGAWVEQLAPAEAQPVDGAVFRIVR